jgi:hypothetical protein
MDYSLESKIWNEAQATFAGEAFSRVVEHAVSSYRRRPGISSIERIHVSDVGEVGLQALRKALSDVHHLPPDEPNIGFVTLRTPLRAHIYYFLQWQVIQIGSSPELIAVDQLERDLNL